MFSEDYDDFKTGYDSTIGIIKYIETKYNISINKPLFAKKIAEYIDISLQQTNLYYDEKFLNTKIGQF